MVIAIAPTMAQLLELVPGKNKSYFYTVVPTAPEYLAQVVFVGPGDFEDVVFNLSQAGDVLFTDFVAIYKNPITRVNTIG